MTDDENKTLVQIGRAARAKALLDDEMLKEAWSQLEKQLIEAMLEIGFKDGDSQRRDAVAFAIQANRRHQQYFRQVIENGKLASAYLKTLHEAKRPRAA